MSDRQLIPGDTLSFQDKNYPCLSACTISNERSILQAIEEGHLREPYTEEELRLQEETRDRARQERVRLAALGPYRIAEIVFERAVAVNNGWYMEYQWFTETEGEVRVYDADARLQDVVGMTYVHKN